MSRGHEDWRALLPVHRESRLSPLQDCNFRTRMMAFIPAVTARSGRPSMVPAIDFPIGGKIVHAQAARPGRITIRY
jgi:hypothetical protein